MLVIADAEYTGIEPAWQRGAIPYNAAGHGEPGTESFERHARSCGMTGSARERLKQQRFEALCEPFRGEVFRFSLWLSRSHQVAEEVMQETLLRAWRSLDSLKTTPRRKSWLLTIARREHARLYERKRHPTVDIDELAAAEASCLAASTIAIPTKCRTFEGDLRTRGRTSRAAGPAGAHGLFDAGNRRAHESQ
jgi:hypothetical protein